MKPVFVLLALTSASAAAEQPGIAITNSPSPSIIAVPANPGPPLCVVPPEAVPVISQPAPPSPEIVRDPQPRRPAQAYVTADDYPPSALAQRQEGIVAFALEIAANGRVNQCVVVESSGSMALDAATCRIMRSRSRFTPAVDSNGNPAVGSISDSVEWRLP